MRISQLSLGGHGAWPDLHLAELSGELNLFCAGPCGGKSTLARLIGHLLYGKTGSPWRQPFGQSASPAEGAVTLQSAAGTFVLRRRRESGNSSTLTIAAAAGAAVNGQTVQALLGGLSPRLAAQLFAVDFAESPQVEWLLSDLFARDFFAHEITAKLRANVPLERAKQSLDHQVTLCRQALADLQTRAVALQTELTALGQEISQFESEWKRLQQERAGLIGSATIEAKRAELDRLESILQQTLNVRVDDPARPAGNEWRISDVLAQLTDGQLVQIHLTRQQTTVTIVDSEGRTLSPEQLSSAQRDQLYVALTLALVSSYANRNINLPLILDEPFLRLDAAAAAVMAGVLEEFARAGHQLLVFTEDYRVRRSLESLSCRVFDLDKVRRSGDTPAPASSQTSTHPVGETLDDTLEGHQTSGLRLASGHGEGDIEAVFYLSVASSLKEFPVLGGETGSVFARLGILSVSDLLAADPKQIADRLNRRDIRTETVALWQSHMSLLCHVSELSLNDAQLLTACGITSPMELREASSDQLWSAIESFLTTDQAGRFISAGQRYSRARIGDWIDAAGGVGSTPLETAVATHKSEP